MPRKKDVPSVTEIELMLARSLYRSDKWDPDRDDKQPFEWEDLRLTYIRRANRLMRTFEKDGLRLSEVSPAAPPAGMPMASMAIR
jgi:hypothetical protein